MHARARMGIFPSVVEKRVEALPEDVAELLRAKHLEGEMPPQPKRRVKLRPVPDYQKPLEGLLL